MTPPPFAITAFYRFSPLSPPEQEALASSIDHCARDEDLRGLIIVSAEGVNGTVAGSEHAIAAIKSLLIARFGESMEWKDSSAPSQPFRRFKVDRRPEIVGLKDTSVFPLGRNGHLSPQEWHNMLETRPDVVVLDTRNTYETKLGKFCGAIDPQLKTFAEFPHYLSSSGLSRDTPLLMYCTGGIRCEKAAIVAQRLGFKEVYQLDGGILNYLAEFPFGRFEGECYVFDNRVSVDQTLRPSSRFKLCPHCGDPAETAIICKNCSRTTKVCDRCLEAPEHHTCSKNCAYHASRTTPPERTSPSAESASIAPDKRI